MARLHIPTIAEAPAKSQPILENYVKVLGLVPNFFALLSQSPDALKAIADMHQTLGKSLGHKTRERIHIMTAEVNGCSYCLTAHTALGAKLHLSAEDMELKRDVPAADIRFVDSGHFALETHAGEIGAAMREFLGRHLG